MKAIPRTRYIATETAISATINTVMAVVPTAISLAGGETVSIASTHGLAVGVVPRLFMSALMSALVPALLARRRRLTGKIEAFSGSGRMFLPNIVFVSLLLAALATALGMLLIGAALPRAAGDSLKLGTMLLFDSVYSGPLATLVTVSALLFLFGTQGAARTTAVTPCRGETSTAANIDKSRPPTPAQRRTGPVHNKAMLNWSKIPRGDSSA